MTTDTEIIPSSGNAFADLGFEKPRELQAKALIAHFIAEVIARRKLTQLQAAELFEIKQPDVSRLVNGKLMGFSLDRLIGFLIALKQDVEISVKPHRGAGAARVRLVTPSSRRPKEKRIAA